MEERNQIEEMAQDICRERTCPTKRNGGECYKKTCKAQIYAERAFDAGYRKRSEVAMEIFEEILDYLMGKGLTYKDWLGLAELKKKYTEGE